MSHLPPPEPPKSGASWVMTYGDMMSLLLTFFVLIVSFSSIQDVKFKNAAMSLQQAFGVLRSEPSVLEQKEPLVPLPQTGLRRDVVAEVERLERSLLEQGTAQAIDVEVGEGGVAFRISAPFLFDSGQAELKEQTIGMLGSLAELFRKFPYPLRVEGHTDSVPIGTARFPSNWDLSAARAVAVARWFQGHGVSPQRMAAVGHGEWRPLDRNDTPEGRGRNRRVEIFLELDEGQEPPRALPLPGEEG